MTLEEALSTESEVLVGSSDPVVRCAITTPNATLAVFEITTKKKSRRFAVRLGYCTSQGGSEFPELHNPTVDYDGYSWRPAQAGVLIQEAEVVKCPEG